MLPLLLLLVMPAALHAATGPRDPYVSGLVREARRAALHDDPYWHTLLHYKSGHFGPRSLVDDPAFFVSPRGHRDPAAELEATLRSFFSPGDTARVHPVCRFPARFAWLSGKLAIDPARLPVPVCAPFETLMARIRPRSVTLIFPTAHMNSPASMYGHTLLTLESASGGRLLAHAINYAAVTTDTFGPLYMVKGLLGGYDGYFSILPYYAKLQEYSDVNDRDIWEYPLTLDETEVRRLLMHLRELEGIRSNYYFFKENCSYDLLFLLEAARPSVRLTDRFSGWVIPLDTVRAVRAAGLVVDVVYRPSKSTKIRHIAALLDGAGRRSALDVAAGRLDPAGVPDRPADPRRRARVLDLAAEVLQYRIAKDEIAAADYQQRFLGALRARSAIGGGDEEAYVIPSPDRPDQGHRSARVRYAFGIGGDRAFHELRLRPAYHDLLDSDRGYIAGSQISFADVVVRYHPRRDRMELRRVDLVDIVSVAPRDAFFRHTSWKVSTGFLRRTTRKGPARLVYGFSTGFGPAFDRGVPGVAYVFAETDLLVGGALEEGYALGAGLSAGILVSPLRDWKMHAFVRDVHYAPGEDGRRTTAGLGQGWRLAPDVGLAADVEYTRERDRERLEATLGCSVYF